MNGSMRVRWSKAQAMTVARSCRGRDSPQAPAEGGQLARLEQFIPAGAAGKFHAVSDCKVRDGVCGRPGKVRDVSS